MRMRMWLCATGFAGNWFNECILLPLIEHMPCVRPSRSHTHVVFVFAAVSNFHLHLVSHGSDLSIASLLSYTVFCEGHSDSPLEKKESN